MTVSGAKAMGLFILKDIMTLSLSIIKQCCLVLREHSIRLGFTKYGATLSLERIPRGSVATSRWAQQP